MIKASQLGVGGMKARVWLMWQSGTYRQSKNIANRQAKHHKGTGMKCGCPFEICEVKLAKDDEWAAKVVCGFHTNLPAKQLEDHLFSGRLTKKEKIY